MGHDVDAERSARAALELAERLDDAPTVNDAQATLATLERRRGDPDSALVLLSRVVDRARLVGDVSTELRSGFSLAGLHHELGDLSGAQAYFDRVAARAAQTGRPWESFGLHARTMGGLLRYTRGDWDGANAVLDTTGQRPPDLASALLRSLELVIRAGRGLPGVLTRTRDLRPFAQREGRIALNCAYAALEVRERAGDTTRAEAEVAETVEVLGKLWLTPWFVARIELSARVVATFATAAATAPVRSRPALANAGREHLEAGWRTVAEGLPAERELGIEGQAWQARLEAEWARLRWLTGDPDGQGAPQPDELVDRWLDAVLAYDYGNETQLARTRARLAEVLRALGRPSEAAEYAGLARQTATRMRAQPLLDTLATLGTRRARRDGRLPGAAALTQRERDVLALLVDGRTNRQIAAQLFISEKTASVHVSNILAKLGVRNRGEAAALARQ
jgi:DNA-binding CsgD family transcriptional regulator